MENLKKFIRWYIMNQTPAFEVTNLEAFLQGIEELDVNGKSVHGIDENDVFDPITKLNLEEQPNMRVVSNKEIENSLRIPWKPYNVLKMEEQQMKEMRDPLFTPSQVAGLDDAPDLVDYYKIANANMLKLEHMFDTDLQRQSYLTTIEKS